MTVHASPFAQHPARLVLVGLETRTVWNEDLAEGFLSS